jgi:Flp pilus assembly protein TadD
MDAKGGKSKIGLGMRALAALNANDFASAVNFAEQAVENSPSDAGYRALLGNAYFGSGRFASAEAAYRDSLSLSSNQPQTVLKLALVQIAQGKNAEALSFLNQARNMLEAADFGLAIALAGQPQESVSVLENAARQTGADARVRQNLAFAYALSGDWTGARNVAAQDLSADLVDARIQQWMALAKPQTAYDQVAALTGFKPVAADPGQPTRLALSPASNIRSAEASQPAAVAASAPQPEPQQQVAQYVPEPQPLAEQAYAPPVAVAEAATPAPQGASRFIAAAAEAVAEAVVEAPAVFAEMIAPKPRKTVASVRAALHKPAALRPAAGTSNSVVQLGAYGSPARVAAAWNEAARRYSALRPYSPVSARFSSANGPVYRLSVKGFGSAEQAKNLCQSLRRAGGECFVRRVAGDAPVRLASR